MKWWYSTSYIPLGTPSSNCFTLIPRDPIEFSELKLGVEPVSITLQAHESWSAVFSLDAAAFLRFTFSLPTHSRLALFGRKNEPPSLTAYHMLEVISQDKSQKLYKRETQVILFQKMFRDLIYFILKNIL